MRLLVLGGGPAGLTAALQARLGEHARAAGIELVEGTGPARFVDPHTAAVGDGRSWRADRIMIAAGGHRGRLPIPGAELAPTHTDIPALTALPGRVAVIGGADTGCQLASSLADFGCQTCCWWSAMTTCSGPSSTDVPRASAS